MAERLVRRDIKLVPTNKLEKENQHAVVKQSLKKATASIKYTIILFVCYKRHQCLQFWIFFLMNVESPQAFCQTIDGQTIPPIIPLNSLNILSIDAGCPHLDEGGEEKENNLLCSESGSYRQKLNRHEGYDHCGNGKHKREDECHPPFTD